MSKSSVITVHDIINDDSALTPKSGDVVFYQVMESLKQKNKTIVSFDGIKYITTAFLNAAIGQLYSKFDSAFLNEFLQVNISEADLPLLQRVLQNARVYFNDKNSFDDALKDIVNE